MFVVCLLYCLNHFTFRSVPSGRHWYQLVCGLVRLPGCQSIRNCQPSGKMRDNLGSYACSSLFGVSRKSFETHTKIFQSLLFCYWTASLFIVRMHDSSTAAFCLLPPALILNATLSSSACRVSRAGSAHSRQCRHCSVTLAHVSPARKCRSKNRHSRENKSAESRAFCYLLCPLRLGVEMGLQWERKAEDLFLVKDGDKNPPHCEAFFSCMWP